MTSIVWFRRDLRLADNPAWSAAAPGPIVPVFIYDDVSEGVRAPGGASQWWLHNSLAALNRALDGALILRRGDPCEILLALAGEAGATRIFWNRLYDPGEVARDKRIKQALKDAGLEVRTFNAALLNEPWEIETKSGEPYKVFTPYWRAATQNDVTDPLDVPETKLRRNLESEDLSAWALSPSKPNWAAGWEEHWTPGEAGARERLDDFLSGELKGYRAGRDAPAKQHTSRLSPHLHWGELSPRQAVLAAYGAVARGDAPAPDVEAFIRELYWREFSHHLLYHWPDLPERNWRRAFDAFPWRSAPKQLEAWRHGRTGYPFVDAGMRQLWQTGYMHNRVRMIAASFLIKHLRIDWREGERWFWDTLVDADLANNSASWQWVAGSGADAAPYFRIFNPVTQGKKFDASGDYVRRWIPELAKLPDKYVHAPFDAPEDAREAAGVVLGENYPAPILSLDAARAKALEGYEAVKAES